ncbi:MAG: ribosome small subunit-dependent GTPase A [Actinomycetota bacterium]|nr:ribosome small subunit-dependent GTPase A [Actinomycetota bacterium]
MHLSDVGYSPELSKQFEHYLEPNFVPARIGAEHRGSYVAITDQGEVSAVVTGRTRFEALGRDELPAVGDWVAIELVSPDRGVVRAVLPRRSALTRKVAGLTTERQVIAANIDLVMVAAALDDRPSLRRIERYMTAAWDSGAAPIVVLTKADLCDDVDAAVGEVAAIAPGADVLALSNATGEGVDEIAGRLGPGTTAAILGPSGVGKSSLINTLMGSAVMTVQEVRWDGKGRHTTTHRELISLPSGGCLIDTPGMRELQLWDSDGLDSSFSDIAQLADQCRFRDCSHDHEPGCAVTAAVDAGALTAARLHSYRKQQRELAAMARKKDKRLAIEAAKKWKRLGKEGKARARIR